jgi:hypothetical protein
VFSSNHTTPGASFAAALRESAAQQQQIFRHAKSPVADTPAGVNFRMPASGRQQNAGQSVRAPTVSSQHLHNLLRVVTAVQQIITESNCALSEEDKIVAITKIVLNLMKQNGHYGS